MDTFGHAHVHVAYHGVDEFGRGQQLDNFLSICPFVELKDLVKDNSTTPQFFVHLSICPFVELKDLVKDNSTTPQLHN